VEGVGKATAKRRAPPVKALEALEQPRPSGMLGFPAAVKGKPGLANGNCDVLKGQCIRSGAGLYYESYEEFAETLYALESKGPLHVRLGINGRDYFKRHYTWPVIERKYLEMFDRLKRDTPTVVGDPLPSWWARRQRTLPPARQVVDRVPAGPVLR